MTDAEKNAHAMADALLGAERHRVAMTNAEKRKARVAAAHKAAETRAANLAARRQRKYDRATRLLSEWEENLQFAQAKALYAANKVKRYRLEVKRCERLRPPPESDQ